MKKEELIKFLEGCGWSRDRWGHLQKEVTRRRPHVDFPVGQEPLITTRHRVKLQATSCRIEVRGEQDWIRVGGDYYSKIVQLDDGRIRVGTHLFGSRK